MTVIFNAEFGHWDMIAGGTMSATRASSRASSRSGCTSGTLELESSTSRRTSRRGVPVSASRAGAARTAAILLISRHLKAVRRDGGAHPPKCAAKGDLDNVCSARSHYCTSRCSGAGGRRGLLERAPSCFTSRDRRARPRPMTIRSQIATKFASDGCEECWAFVESSRERMRRADDARVR